MIWRNPKTEHTRSILAIALSPTSAVSRPRSLKIKAQAGSPAGPGFSSMSSSREEFRSGGRWFAKAAAVETEVAATGCAVAGLVGLGPSLVATANLITQPRNLSAPSRAKPPGASRWALIRVTPGADPVGGRRACRPCLPQTLSVLNKADLRRSREGLSAARSTANRFHLHPCAGNGLCVAA